MEQDKFTVGQVAQALGINAQTLRYYEKEGLLSVEQDGGNRYRQYTQLDLRMALFARLYRSMGFSVDETKALLHDAETDVLEQALSKRLAAVQAERRELERLEGAIGQRLRDVEEAEAKCGGCWLEELHTNIYAVLKNGSRYQLSPGKHTDELLIELQGRMPYTRQVFYVPQGVLTDPALPFEQFYGMLALEDWVQKAGLEQRLAGCRIVLDGPVVMAVLRSDAEWTDRAFFQPVLDFAAQKGLRPAGPMLSTILTTRFQRDRHINYYKFWMQAAPLS